MPILEGKVKTHSYWMNNILLLSLTIGMSLQFALKHWHENFPSRVILIVNREALTELQVRLKSRAVIVSGIVSPLSPCKAGVLSLCII